MAITRSSRTRKTTAVQRTPSRRKSRLYPPKRSRKGQQESSPPNVTPSVCGRTEHPEDYPDLDFHHNFGSFLTRKNPISSTINPEIAKYWSLLSETPALLQHHIHNIAEKYRRAFRDFFTADQISLHGHVSDASNAALLTSLISHLVSHASPDCKVSFFSEEDKSVPRIAILEGGYGAGYGCLAYDAVISAVRPLANGPRPVIIKTKTPSKIDAQIKNAKKKGCIALIAELVRASDGKAISEHAWKSLLTACEKYALILIVDEALTTIRCGAPFAYQLPHYSTHGLPDLILFGKAIRTNGIAVEWRGINTRKLNIKDAEHRLFTILDWQERLTEMAPAADLLTSWGTLLLARKEQWPRRAQRVGTLLREFLAEEGVGGSEVGGLHSLIYISLRGVARLRSPVMGAKAGRYVRWLPVLDRVMASEKELRAKVFGAGSIEHRKSVSKFLKGWGVQLGFCGRCGDAVEGGRRGCEVCVVRFCEECEGGGHVCPMQSL